MKRMLRVLPLVTLLWVAAPAKADFYWFFPYGETAIVQALSSVGHAFIFFDYFYDIYVVSTNHSSTPLATNLGAGPAYAHYLEYQYSNVSGDVYNVYIDQGTGFFYVGTYLL